MGKVSLNLFNMVVAAAGVVAALGGVGLAVVNSSMGALPVIVVGVSVFVIGYYILGAK